MKKFISVHYRFYKPKSMYYKEQNYTMLPIYAMKEEGFECEIFAIHTDVKEDFFEGFKFIHYKNIFQYIGYLFKNRNEIIYSNTSAIRTLMIGMFVKKSVFMPHWCIFGSTKIRKLVLNFFYKFYTKVRAINTEEVKLLNDIKPNLGFLCPLAISETWYTKNDGNRNGAVWFARICSPKNPEMLIKLGKLLKENKINLKIQIIGSDDYKDKNGKSFTELVKENKLESYLELLGWKNHNEAKKIISKAKIMINTSSGEGQCLTVYEQSLAGCFPLLSNIMSFPSVFGKNALYHNNVEELYQNLIKVLNMPKEEYLKIIEENQKMILEKYNYDYIKLETKKMFLSL